MAMFTQHAARLLRRHGATSLSALPPDARAELEDLARTLSPQQAEAASTWSGSTAATTCHCHSSRRYRGRPTSKSSPMTPLASSRSASRALRLEVDAPGGEMAPNRGPLPLRRAAPDTVAVARAQGMGETCGRDGAGRTDHAGLLCVAPAVGKEEVGGAGRRRLRRASTCGRRRRTTDTEEPTGRVRWHRNLLSRFPQEPRAFSGAQHLRGLGERQRPSAFPIGMNIGSSAV